MAWHGMDTKLGSRPFLIEWHGIDMGFFLFPFDTSDFRRSRAHSFLDACIMCDAIPGVCSPFACAKVWVLSIVASNLR